MQEEKRVRRYKAPEKEKGRTCILPHYLFEKASRSLGGCTIVLFYQMFVSSFLYRKTCAKFENESN